MVIVARSPDEKVVAEARKLYKSGMPLVDIARKIDKPAGTVRRWKSTYDWDEEKQSERSDEKANVRKENKSNKKKPVADEVEAVIQNTELTDKQRLFCVYYIRCFNATKAYQKAYGVNYTTAASIGYRLLENDGVKKEILRLKQEKLNREFLSESDIFQKYMDIAFADMTDYVEFVNEEIDITIPTGEKKTITVSHVNVKSSDEVDGTLINEVSKGKDGVKVKLANREKALQWLSDHMDCATAEQRARLAILQAKIDGDSPDEAADDGFLDALNASAREDWSDEED